MIITDENRRKVAHYLADYLATEMLRVPNAKGGAWPSELLQQWIDSGLNAYESINNTTPENAKLYHITYRQEFVCTVRAISEADAIDKAQASHEWELLTGGWWPEYVSCELADLT